MQREVKTWRHNLHKGVSPFFRFLQLCSERHCGWAAKTPRETLLFLAKGSMEWRPESEEKSVTLEPCVGRTDPKQVSIGLKN